MKHVVSMTFLIVALTTGVGLVSAQETITPTKRPLVSPEQLQQRQEMRKEGLEKRDEAQEQRCTNVTAAIQKRVTQYEQHSTKRRESYGKITANVTQLLEKLDASSVDTSELSEKLNEFKGLVADYEEKAELANAALVKTQGFACGESQGQFKTALETSKKAFEEARIAARTAHDYFVKSVRPELQKLREQVKQSKISKTEVKE